jgi:hypothetical protein
MNELAPELTEVLKAVRHVSMVSDEVLLFTWRAALQVLHSGIPGAIIECGTWRGGASFGLALAQKRVFGRVIRPILMLDSFAGLPSPTLRDGPAALQWAHRIDDPGYFNNCTASLDEVMSIRDQLGLSADECRLVPGWFDTSVPRLVPELRSGIAFLRVDCDWYDPVRFVLEQLEPLVNDEGIVLLDDYFAWDGCARAVHDFLSANDHAYRLHEIGDQRLGAAAWFVKRRARIP